MNSDESNESNGSNDEINEIDSKQDILVRLNLIKQHLSQAKEDDVVLSADTPLDELKKHYQEQLEKYKRKTTEQELENAILLLSILQIEPPADFNIDDLNFDDLDDVLKKVNAILDDKLEEAGITREQVYQMIGIFATVAMVTPK